MMNGHLEGPGMCTSGGGAPSRRTGIMREAVTRLFRTQATTSRPTTSATRPSSSAGIHFRTSFQFGVMICAIRSSRADQTVSRLSMIPSISGSPWPS